MNTNTLTVTNATPHIATFRLRLLRIHGTILGVVGLGMAIYCTIARYTGLGPYGFLLQNPMAWVGLVQAYLLMALVAGLLLRGAGEAKARKWDVVGALAHVAPLFPVILSWHLFASLGFGAYAIFSITFHSIWICLESFAALYPDEAS